MKESVKSCLIFTHTYKYCHLSMYIFLNPHMHLLSLVWLKLLGISLRCAMFTLEKCSQVCVDGLKDPLPNPCCVPCKRQDSDQEHRQFLWSLRGFVYVFSHLMTRFTHDNVLDLTFLNAYQRVYFIYYTLCRYVWATTRRTASAWIQSVRL